MELSVIVALISGMAIIIAASIQAYGNVSAARHKLNTLPETKDIPQEVANPATNTRRRKGDWRYRILLLFMVSWWVFAIWSVDITKNRFILAIVIIHPSIVGFMVTVKYMLNWITDILHRVETQIQNKSRHNDPH